MRALAVSNAQSLSGSARGLSAPDCPGLVVPPRQPGPFYSVRTFLECRTGGARLRTEGPASSLLDFPGRFGVRGFLQAMS